MDNVKVVLTDEDLENINGGREIEKIIRFDDCSITVRFQYNGEDPIAGKDLPGGNDEHWIKR